MKYKAAEMGLISRHSNNLAVPRTFSAPDVFENVGGCQETGMYGSSDIIMTEPALSRINEPFEPQKHSQMIIEEEFRGSSTTFVGLLNSVVKYDRAAEEASDRDFSNDKQRKLSVQQSHVNHLNATHSRTMQSTIALNEQ